MHPGDGDRNDQKTKRRGQAPTPTLFATLVHAHKAGLIIISVKANRLNHPESPVWDAGENVAPLLAMLIFSIILMLAGKLIIGVAFLALSAISYVALIRPWVLQRVSRRALTAA